MSGKQRVMPEPDNPMATARALLKARTHGGKHTLRAWRGGWMTWRGTHWAEAEPGEIRAWIYGDLENAVYKHTAKDGTSGDVPWKPNRHRMANVIEAMAAITHLPGTISPPAWIGTDGTVPAGEIVACANGLLHVGTRVLHGHAPGYFNEVAVPFAYAADAPPPVRWLAFLGELWPGDPEAIATLQEWFGYVLSGRTDLQKMLLAVGPIRSGKGTIRGVLADLIGRGNVAGPTLASLGAQFGLASLIGKPLAVVSDARLNGADPRQAVERLLSISGEDPLDVDRKFRPVWTGKLPSRFMIMSNELPGFGDAAGAIATRFVTLILTESWLGREDKTLAAALSAELPGILNWALDGLDRLARTGRLTEPASSADAVAALADLVSPVSAFVRDQCQRGGEIRVDLLYREYRAWCNGNGNSVPSKQVFGKDLRAAVPVLRVGQRQDENGKLYRVYRGLSVTPDSNGEIRVSPREQDQPGESQTRTDTRKPPLPDGVAKCIVPRCKQPARRYPGGTYCDRHAEKLGAAMPARSAKGTTT